MTAKQRSCIMPDSFLAIILFSANASRKVGTKTIKVVMAGCTWSGCPWRTNSSSIFSIKWYRHMHHKLKPLDLKSYCTTLFGPQVNPSLVVPFLQSLASSLGYSKLWWNICFLCTVLHCSHMLTSFYLHTVNINYAKIDWSWLYVWILLEDFLYHMPLP